MDGTEKEDTSKLPYSDDDYYQAALLLSRTYPAMKSERENIKKWQTGEKKYTEEDALRELISITGQTDDMLGVRVQTSGTSDPTGDIATLLADGYVEKKENDIAKEFFTVEMQEYAAYLDWKIGIVETAMSEQMSSVQRAIYERLFFKGFTYSQLINGNKGRRRLNKWRIHQEKNKALEAIASEIETSAGFSRKEHGSYITNLMDEVRKEEISENGE